MKGKFRIIFLVSLILIVAGMGLIAGKEWFTPVELFEVLTGQREDIVALTITVFRAPRVCAALLAGAGLGCSGYILQKITQNDLADPGILGINAGAGLTVLVYLGFFASGANSFTLPLVACIGGLLAAGLVYMIAVSHRRLIVSRLLLAGIAVNAGLSALTLLTTTMVSKANYNFVVSWLAGTIWGASWEQVRYLVLVSIVTMPILFFKERILAILALGEETAIGLGLAVKREQVILLFIAVCQAAVSVAVVGSISFIGLMTPHITKRLIKEPTAVTTALTGGLLLSSADILARLMPFGEIPTGIIVALIGAPCFAYLLFKKS